MEAYTLRVYTTCTQRYLNYIYRYLIKELFCPQYTNKSYNSIIKSQGIYKKWASNLTLMSQRKTWMINKHMRRCSTSWLIRKIQINIRRLSYHNPMNVVYYKLLEFQMLTRMWSQLKFSWIVGGPIKWNDQIVEIFEFLILIRIC